MEKKKILENWKLSDSPYFLYINKEKIMEENKSKFYSLMVVGDNPLEMIKKYDATMEVEPYVKYRYDDAGKIKKKAIKLMQDIIDNSDKVSLTNIMIDYLKERIKNLISISDFEYYSTLTDGLEINSDGDAITTENPDGKYKTCRVGKNLCIPLTLKDGSSSFSAKAGDVDWGKMHMANCDLYRISWELYNGEREPQNSQEKSIYDNIKNQKRYFEAFENVENYIKYNCSYWNYAYLDNNGWHDASDRKNYEWITSFYDKYVLPLKYGDVVTIFECSI